MFERFERFDEIDKSPFKIKIKIRFFVHLIVNPNISVSKVIIK